MASPCGLKASHAFGSTHVQNAKSPVTLEGSSRGAQARGARLMIEALGLAECLIGPKAVAQRSKRHQAQARLMTMQASGWLARN